MATSAGFFMSGQKTPTGKQVIVYYDDQVRLLAAK